MHTPRSGARLAGLRALRSLKLALATCALLWLAACSGIKLVADYDAEAAKVITDSAAATFAFYDRMREARTGQAKLPYAAFKDDWGRIETQLRVMLVREESRALNSDSEFVARTILALWQKYREQHASKDDYALVQLGLHRDRFQRLFTAALRAEKAKQLASGDTDPKLEE